MKIRTIYVSSSQQHRRRVLGHKGLTNRIFGSVGAQGLSLITGLFATLLLARFMSASQFGIYSYVFSWIVVLAGASMSGRGQVIVREVGRFGINAVDSAAVITWALIRGLVFGLIAGLSFLVASLVFYQQSPDVKWTMIVSAVMIPTFVVTNVFESYLQGTGHPFISTFCSGVIRFSILIALLLIWATFTKLALSSQDAIGLMLVAALFATFFAWYFARKNKLPVKFHLKSASPATAMWNKSSRWLLLVGALATIGTRLDVILVGLLVGPGNIGAYALASRILQALCGIGLGVAIAVSPLLSKLFHTDQTLTRFVRALVIASILGVLITAAAAALIVLTSGVWLKWFGPDYHNIFELLMILLVGTVIWSISSAASAALNMTGGERRVALIVVYQVAVAFILTVILVPLIGVTGAAIGYAVGMATFTVATLLNARSHFRARHKALPASQVLKG